MTRPLRDKHSQKGEAEMMLFGIVVILCAVVSGSLMILNWVKDSKNAKVQEHLNARFKRGTPAPVLVAKDPAAYYAHCQKSPAALLSSTIKCDVMDESYGELYVMPFESQQ
jgi:hypothetical protein